MSASMYPNGINNLVLRGMPITQSHPGQVFWVSNADNLYKEGGQKSNGADSSDRGTVMYPFRTIDYAVGQCTAGRGDIILVMPGHAETYSTATATGDDLTVDVAGVAIVGLGCGSLRPTITQSTEATQQIRVSADNVTFVNIYFTSTVQDLAICIDYTGAAHFSLINCQWDDSTAALNYINILEDTGTANTTDGLLVQDCVYNGLDPSFNTFCVIAGDQDNYQFIGNMAWSEDATTNNPVLLDVTGDATNLWMTKNLVNTKDDDNSGIMVGISGTASTGWVYDCLVTSLDVAGGDTWTVASKIRGGIIYHGSVRTTQAALIDPPANA